MTTVHIKMPVTLVVAGPLLISGNTGIDWGLDAAFYRNWQGQYAIPGSQVRGKLKEAMREIIGIANQDGQIITRLFGKECSDSISKIRSYVPLRGILKITDFIFSGTDQAQREGRIHTRIRIDSELGTVEKGALLISEAPFLSDEKTNWEGSIAFSCIAGEEDAYLDQIKRAFLFITGFGAEKTVGYGRVKKVIFQKHIIMKPSPVSCNTGPAAGLRLSIAPEEPIIVGGIRRNDNIFVSEEIIPGTVLKGSLAAGLNQMSGHHDLKGVIDNDNALVKVLYPRLAEAFSDLIFLHGIPAMKMFERAKTIPLSGVTYGGKYEDISFESGDVLYSRGLDPICFQVDWKGIPDNLPQAYALPRLEYHPVTRTAIDRDTRKADDSKLYSFHMIKPCIGADQVYWNSEIRFPEGLTEQQNLALLRELRSVLDAAMRYMGKRQTAVKIKIEPIPVYSSVAPEEAGDFALILQTPAMIVEDRASANKGEEIFDNAERMRQNYEAYWQTVFSGTAEFKTYYASQEMQGAYLGMRFMSHYYRPFYLTSKGSAFIFEVRDKKAWKTVENLKRFGLQIPEWASRLYGSEPWKHCPFVPENGYGEIVVQCKN